MPELHRVGWLLGRPLAEDWPRQADIGARATFATHPRTTVPPTGSVVVFPGAAVRVSDHANGLKLDGTEVFRLVCCAQPIAVVGWQGSVSVRGHREYTPAATASQNRVTVSVPSLL